MQYITLDKLSVAELQTNPFDYVVVPGFISADTIKEINNSFPKIAKGGSYPVASLTDDMSIKKVIDELEDAAFEDAICEKFNVNVRGKPKVFSLRGWLRSKDGQIHTDSKDKIITVLIYLNEVWRHDGGRLRLLRDGKNLENYVAEVSPDDGTMLAFRRCDHSWHGHYPFEGERRALQMNWMRNESRAGLHAIRHRLSATLKSMHLH
jgi:SM-20-related protein